MTRSIFITGAGSGIGLATARRFLAEGWRVGCFDIAAASLDLLRMEGGDAVLARVLDVTDRAAVLAAVAEFSEWTGGRMDLLFSNAGIDAKGPFADMAWERITAVVDVNLMGTLALVHASIPLLRVTPESLCLVTASASAIVGAPRMAAYSASKGAVRALVEALSVELAVDGVRVADLIPGIIDTGMLPPELKAMLPTEGMWRPMPACAVAAAALEAYRGNRLHWYVPDDLAAYDMEVTRLPEAVRDRRIAGAPF